MAANPTTAKNFLVSTDYPLDKIIFKASGSVTVASGGFSDVYTNHNLPVLPLLKGVWSFTSDFAITYFMGSPLYADTDDVDVSVQSNATQYRILANNNSASSKTIYWRIYGVMDTTNTSTIDFTANEADSFALNTDFNYTKLYLSGDVNIASSTQVINHNLGYRPQVDVWFELALVPGQYAFYDLGVGNDNGVFNSVKISTTNLTFSKGSLGGLSTNYKYRIYLDE